MYCFEREREREREKDSERERERERELRVLLLTELIIIIILGNTDVHHQVDGVRDIQVKICRSCDAKCYARLVTNELIIFISLINI